MTTDYLHKLSLRAEHSVDSWNTTEPPPWVDPIDPPGPPYPPWPPTGFCDDFESRLKIHTASVISPNTCVGLSASGGVPPYSFSIVSQSGGHYWLDGNQVCADATACGHVTIRVTDVCSNTADHDLVAPAGHWDTAVLGCSPRHQAVHPGPDTLQVNWDADPPNVLYTGYPSSPGEQYLQNLNMYSTYGKYKQRQFDTPSAGYACVIPYGTEGGTPNCNCIQGREMGESWLRNSYSCDSGQSIKECTCEYFAASNGGYCDECISESFFKDGLRTARPNGGDGECVWYNAGYGYYFFFGVWPHRNLNYQEWVC